MSVVEKEAFAIITSLENSRTLVYGQQLYVYCDNQDVTHMDKCKGRVMQRMSTQIDEYDPKICKIKGENNTMADLLSRMYKPGAF